MPFELFKWIVLTSASEIKLWNKSEINSEVNSEINNCKFDNLAIGQVLPIVTVIL